MARQLSAEEIAIFRECFNEYDQDRGGNISVEEFGRVMRKTNPNISDEEVSKVISEVDLDGDGTINFDEFITMMTGQPYKSPEAAAPVAPEAKTDGMQTTSDSTSTSILSPSVAAFRGVTTVSARLQRQRLANQVYKDAWTTIEPSLKGSLTPRELLDKVIPLAGLDGQFTEADLKELTSDPSAGSDGKITYNQFLEFAKRQEVDDIVSGYGV